MTTAFPATQTHHHYRRTLIATALTAAIGLPAQAQQTALEEITVTAQKREQNLQQVPIAISAFGDDTIRNLGADNIDQLSMFTAGVEANNNSITQVGYTIRGINSDSFTAGTDPSAAVYVDGVYTSRGGGALINFSDIERVEVLRGPQGTLFGRNTASGAIHIITHKPSNETEGSVRMTLGNANKQKIEATVNTALSDNVYLRGSLAVNSRDGLFDNAGGGADYEQQDDQTYRLALLWDASETTEVIWRAEYNEIDQDGPNSISSNPSLNPGLDPFNDVNLDTKTLESRELFGTSLELTHKLDGAEFKSITSYRTFNTFNREDEDGSASPYFFAFTDNIEEQEQYSQEFRLTSDSDGPLKWTTGLSYFKENLDQEHVIGFNVLTLETFATQTIAGSPLFSAALDASGGQLNNSNVVNFINGNPNGDTATAIAHGVWAGAIGAPYTLGDGLGVFIAQNPSIFPGGGALAPFIGTGALAGILNVSANNNWTENTRNSGSFESWAVYGDATYSLTERLDITLGARYTYDDKSFSLFSEYQNSLAGSPAGLAFAIPVDDSGSDSWSAFTPRLVVAYELSDDAMVYASATTGFKSGGFNSFSIDADGNPLNGGELIPFDEEKVTSYELGLKSTWLDNSLMLNATAFLYEYKDQQSLDLTSDFSPTQVLPTYAVRQSDTEGTGIEIEAAWVIDEHWLLGGNYSYLDTEFTDYQTFPGEDPVADNKKGEALPSAPKNRWNLFIQHSLPIANIGTLTTNITYHYSDERLPDDAIESADIPVIDSYEIVNARISFIDTSETWEVALWSNNLLDEEWLLGVGGTGDAIGSAPVDRADPRTYGIDFVYNF